VSHGSIFRFFVHSGDLFWAMLSVRCLSCLSVCNVRALWPNGWTDQDETWRAGTPRPWPHCVRWGPSSTSPKGAHPSPIFGPYLLRQTVRWMKLVLGMVVGLSPGDFLLDGDPASSHKRGQSPLPNFRLISVVAKRLDASRCHLVRM